MSNVIWQMTCSCLVLLLRRRLQVSLNTHCGDKSSQCAQKNYFSLGSRNVKVDTFGDELTSNALPPTSCTRLRTIAKPNPVPRCRVVKKGSQILSRKS